MKHLFHSLSLYITAVVVSLSLSSCYFNSAGHLFDNASYEAQVTTADIAPGTPIYEDSGNYYVELPRYKSGAPVITQYPAKEQPKAPYELRPTGEKSMVRISSQYATYLCGKEILPAGDNIEALYQGNADSLKRRSRVLSSARTPQIISRHDFNYTSPGAFFWYTFGLLDWLCIDLPITCVENGVMVCVGGLMLLDQAYKSSKNFGKDLYPEINPHLEPGERACRGCGGSGHTSYSDYLPCVLCGGTGRYEDGERGFEYWAAAQSGY